MWLCSKVQEFAVKRWEGVRMKAQWYPWMLQSGSPRENRGDELNAQETRLVASDAHVLFGEGPWYLPANSKASSWPPQVCRRSLWTWGSPGTCVVLLLWSMQCLEPLAPNYTRTIWYIRHIFLDTAHWFIGTFWSSLIEGRYIRWSYKSIPICGTRQYRSFSFLCFIPTEQGVVWLQWHSLNANSAKYDSYIHSLHSLWDTLKAYNVLRVKKQDEQYTAKIQQCFRYGSLHKLMWTPNWQPIIWLWPQRRAGAHGKGEP